MSSEAKVVGYCRQCGKALDAGAVRTAHGTIYCEEHLPMTVGSAGTVENPQAATVGTTPAGMNPPTITPIEGTYANPYTARTPPPLGAGPMASSYNANQEVSPGLAFGLGLIPGVGAIYNGQYSKGLMHVVIFGLMISILDSGASRGLTPLVALLFAGFCCYMPFEAFHTAQRRQRGLVTDEFSSLFPVHGSSRFPVAPVVLIALGVIFLLNNLELLDLDRVLRYWPVMLIGLGAYMLFARMGGNGPSSKQGSGLPRENDR